LINFYKEPIQNLGLKPDDLVDPPTFDWPSSRDDIVVLMLGGKIDNIKTEINSDAHGTRLTVGVKMLFKGQKDIVTFGKEGNGLNRAVFNDY
jgi:hypothetical protein